MATTHVTCPRCDGTKIIRVLYCPPGFGAAREKGKYIEADCPMCRGTGRASMLEPMGKRERGTA